MQIEKKYKNKVFLFMICLRVQNFSNLDAIVK